VSNVNVLVHGFGAFERFWRKCAESSGRSTGHHLVGVVNLLVVNRHSKHKMTIAHMHPPPFAISTTDLGTFDQFDLIALEQVRRAEPDGLRALYDRHHAGLYRFLRAALSKSDAEEVLQDVFLAVWRNANRFQERSSVASWLYGIARNLARNANRQTQRRQRREMPLEVDLAATPQARAFEEVLQAVRSLPSHERQVVELVHLGELSLQETAKLLGIPLGTVKSRLHNARKHLQVTLEAAGFGPERD
jgi:RNA polymerase sigma-70 factor, ECF subfamily